VPRARGDAAHCGEGGLVRHAAAFGTCGHGLGA
jgi:hypothetical protein